MKAKILFFDDIFSDLYREQLSPEHLMLDDNWVSALIEALTGKTDDSDVVFEVIKSGEIDTWRELIEKEKPDLILLDLFWPQQAFIKFEDRSRGSDISMEILPEIRSSFPNLPLVCYTIKPDKGMMERAYSKGATFFLEKVPLALPEVHSPLKFILIYLSKKAREEL
ncbi:MAG: response regulator [Desulfatiglans sp.]|jgi:DNA-binding NarL/FixJ family response regulator|nr:response regulator [Desulfatiglans sp.]